MLLQAPLLLPLFLSPPLPALTSPLTHVPAPYPARGPMFDPYHQVPLEKWPSHRRNPAELVTSRISGPKITATKNDGPVMHTWAAQVD